MKSEEKKLFRALCSFKADVFDEALLQAATPAVLGQLFFNRMQAVAYGVLARHGLLGRVNREFRNSLKMAYEQNVEKNKSFFHSVAFVGETLSGCDRRYAMLKGAYLCRAYPEGFRTSNDIDLLVNPTDVTEIGNALLKAGFRQGNIRNESFVPATRKEIIGSKMMRGETVPYIKQMGLPGMNFLEVDINFSLDYKPGGSALLEEMLKNTSFKGAEDLKIRTLKDDDFFIHLCCHLYKEAATLPWVEMMRDMTLYKYADIYMLLSDMNHAEIDALFARAKQTYTDKICAFAAVQMSELFNFANRYAADKARDILKNDPEFIHTVISPKDKKAYVFSEKSVEERFFSGDRKSLLQEVNAK